MTIQMQHGNMSISTIIRKFSQRKKIRESIYTNEYLRTSHPDSNEKNLEEEIDDNLLDTTGYELVLPSGKKVGHRTLVRYYRQSLTNRNNERSVELVNRIKDKYRALGWSGPGTTGL